MKSERQYFEHILEELDFIQSQSKSLSRDAFLEDQVLKRAVVRSIEIIGEAIKKSRPMLRINMSRLNGVKSPAQEIT